MRKVSQDNEFLSMIREMKTKIDMPEKQLTKTAELYEKESVDNRTQLSEQQKTINTLLHMIPKDKNLQTK